MSNSDFANGNLLHRDDVLSNENLASEKFNSLNLFDAYCDIVKNPSRWDYYIAHRKSPSLNDIHDYTRKSTIELLDTEMSKEFIREYFQIGGKNDALEDILTVPDSYQDAFLKRCSHTVSAFFLGLLIVKAIAEPSNIFFLVGNERFSFTYVWFLTCLYHDIGYLYELDNDIKDKISKDPYCWSSFFKMKEYLGITQNCDSKSNYNMLLSWAMKPTQIVFVADATKIHISRAIQYSSDIEHNYFKYKAMELGEWDHGIVGGKMFLDRMIKNYDNNFKRAMEGSLSDFEYNDLRFQQLQLPLFYYIANSIAAHNIWKAPREKDYLYKKYELEKLTDENFIKISLHENPLLFILGVVDSLEPVKDYIKNSSERPSNALRDINIRITPTERTISFTYFRKTKYEVMQIANSIRSWINVSIIHNFNTMTISLDEHSMTDMSANNMEVEENDQ